MAKLDKEEKELLKSYEDGEWKSVSNKKREVGRLQDYATATFKKDRRINIRISSKDLAALQKESARGGDPLSNSGVEHPAQVRVWTSSRRNRLTPHSSGPGSAAAAASVR